MQFNPKIHHRRSIRLKGYDYSLPGAYFITILSFQCKESFGQIHDNEMILFPLGELIQEEWFRSTSIRKEIILNQDELMIMPNHLHAIVWITHLDNNRENSSSDNILDVLKAQKQITRYIIRKCIEHHAHWQLLFQDSNHL